MRFAFLILFLLPCLSCRAVHEEKFATELIAEQKAKPPTKKTTKKPLTKSNSEFSFASLKPLLSGAGVMVFAPQSTQLNKFLDDFGAGLSLLMFWHLGNYGELGKTPQMDRVFESAKEFRFSNLRVPEQQIGDFGKSLGVTHIVTGTIEGSADQCTLTYRLLALDTSRQLGETLKLSGTQSQIIKDLPQAIQTLAKQLDVASPALPEMAALTPNDVTAIGNYDWIKIDDLSRTQVDQLAKAAQHEPLAAYILLSRSLWISDEQEANVRAVLSRAMPRHLPLTAMMTLTGLAPLKNSLPVLNTWQTKYPNNFQVNLLLARNRREQNDIAGEQAAAEKTLRCAPSNPQSWLGFSTVVSNRAQALRSSRTIGQMTEAELASLDKLYVKRQQALEHALKIAPNNLRVLRNMAEAATFSGNSETAKECYWKALALDPNGFTTLQWGTEMFQPKWFDDKESLQKVVKAILAAKFIYAEEAIAMSQQMQTLEQLGVVSADAKISDAVIANHTRQYQALLGKHPDSVLALRNLTTLYGSLGSLEYAKDYHRMWVERGPKRKSVAEAMQ